MTFIAPPAAARHLRVLVVEDEALIRWAVVETLTDAGHTVLEAGDGVTALATVGQKPASIDVVLLDVRLPDADGLSLLEQIRQQSPSSAVVMMTAHGSPQMTAHAKGIGAYDVITKPFDLRGIEALLVRAHDSKTR